MDLALRSSRAAESLSRWLAPLTFADWSAPRVTAALTQGVVDWGAAHGWRVRREVPSIAGLPGAHPDRPGYLDVVCERLDGPPIAIEIDRSDKQWSSRKLLCEADAGVVAVWVRWGSPRTWIVPHPVALVDIPTTRRRVAGRLLYSRAASIAAAAPEVQSATVPARCRATTRKGQPCPIGPRPSGLCHLHDPAVQCGARKKNGQRCGNATGGGRCAAHENSPMYNDAPTLL
ncbi:hypothetical protein AB0B20_12955 [Micromonospora sp. NPDC049151]|uniref:hypothetical protein n=1 Tax=Micromonospora sp. NPDC049151 TaxID=3155648 RepID=UPI0033C66C24